MHIDIVERAVEKPQTMQELTERYADYEILAMLRKEHPDGESVSVYDLFRYNYERVHGPIMCPESRARVEQDAASFSSSGTLQLYLVRSLLQ